MRDIVTGFEDIDDVSGFYAFHPDIANEGCHADVGVNWVMARKASDIFIEQSGEIVVLDHNCMEQMRPSNDAGP
jgi:hypothetical protein